MSFLDEAVTHTRTQGGTCEVHKWLETQTDLDDAALNEAIAATNRSAVWRAMVKRGFEFKLNSVQRHTTRMCACRS